jgi:FHA domain
MRAVADNKRMNFGAATQTDPFANAASLDDEPIRLRYWASDRPEPLGKDPYLILGSEADCSIRLDDPSRRTSRHHAAIVRDASRVFIRDLRSKNGVRVDGARHERCELVPGSELTIGGRILIVESTRSIALRSYLARVIGWGDGRNEEVDLALRAIRAAGTGRDSLVLCGGADSLSIAYAIHRISRGADKPFITCDRKRRSPEESGRTFRNVSQLAEAVEQARGGTICVWGARSRLPHDYAASLSAVRDPSAHTQLVVCAGTPRDAERFLAAPIVIPPLVNRPDEIEHVIREYVHEAIAELGVSLESLAAADRAWILENMSMSLREIETAAYRLVALRGTENINQAAALLGLAHVSLKRWAERWNLL